MSWLCLALSTLKQIQFQYKYLSQRFWNSCHLPCSYNCVNLDMLFHLSKPCFFLCKRSDSTCLQKALTTLKNMLQCVVQYRSLKMILPKIYFLYLCNVVYVFYLEPGSKQSQTKHDYIVYTSGNCLVHKLPETLCLFFSTLIFYTHICIYT